MTRLNWDRENRQARLWRYLRRNPPPEEWLSPSHPDDVEMWAREQVRKVAKRTAASRGSPLSRDVSVLLSAVDAALEREDVAGAKEAAMKAADIVRACTLAGIDRVTSQSVTYAVCMVLKMSESPSTD